VKTPLVAFVAASEGETWIQAVGQRLSWQVGIRGRGGEAQERAFIHVLSPCGPNLGGVFTSLTVMKIVWAALRRGAVVGDTDESRRTLPAPGFRGCPGKNAIGGGSRSPARKARAREKVKRFGAGESAIGGQIGEHQEIAFIDCLVTLVARTARVHFVDRES